MIDRTEHPRIWLALVIWFAVVVTTTVIAFATTWVAAPR
jgi:hypothetical protein